MLEIIGMLPVSQLPRREPIRVAAETRLADVVTLMRDKKQGAALVVSHGALVGIFTEHDLLRRVDHRSLSWRDQPVHQVMTARPVVIGENDSLAEALRRMEVGKRRHLPVMRGREAIGLLSIRDLLAYIAGRFPADFINLPPDPDHAAREPWGG